MKIQLLTGFALCCLMACGGEPEPVLKDTPLAPHLKSVLDDGSSDYLPPAPGPKTATKIVASPTAQIFIGKWNNKSELCKMEIRAEQVCKIHCTDPDATNPDDFFEGIWSIEGAQLVVSLTTEWWHGRKVLMEYDEAQKALYKVHANGERIYIFTKI